MTTLLNCHTQLIVPLVELIRHAEAMRHRIDAIDAAASGIAEGMRQNVLQPEATYHLLDMIASDLKARADQLLCLLGSG